MGIYQLIFIGILGLCLFSTLGFGLYAMVKGKGALSQRMMRMRIFMQGLGLAILALLVLFSKS